MINKRLWSIAIVMMLLVFPVSASMVSFMMVETGLNEEISTQYTSLWEGGLMAAFWDAGHIVTNIPIARLDKKPAKDFTGPLADDLNEAASGGADYFVLGYLEYNLSGESAVPVGLVLKLYSTDSKKLLFEQKFNAGSGKSLDEEYTIAQNAGRVILSHLKER